MRCMHYLVLRLGEVVAINKSKVALTWSIHFTFHISPSGFQCHFLPFEPDLEAEFNAPQDITSEFLVCVMLQQFLPCFKFQWGLNGACIFTRPGVCLAITAVSRPKHWAHVARSGIVFLFCIRSAA